MEVEKTAYEIKNNEHVINMLDLLKNLLQQFAGGKSLDTLLSNWTQIRQTIRTDRETQEFFEEFRNYVIKVLENTNLMANKEMQDKGRSLVIKLREINEKKFNGRLRDVVSDLNLLISNVENDPLLNNLKNDTTQLLRDVFLDDQGNFVFRADVLQQLAVLVLSSLKDQRLPLADIFIQTENFDLSLRNLSLGVVDIIPKQVLVENRAKILIDLPNELKNPEVKGTANGTQIILYAALPNNNNNIFF